MKKLNIVGIMSGTSLDGVDFILVEQNIKELKYKDMGSIVYPKGMKRALLELAEGRMSFRDSQRLHFKLGKFYAHSLDKIQRAKKWKINLIGLHGQTVFHQALEATAQIGEPSYLKRFNVPVVSDFRSKILSIGGQGAPLAPLFHNVIMGNKKNWGFLNIGGVSNITFKENKKLSATDIGPGNIFLDGAMRKLFSKDFDCGGKIALKGIPDIKLAKGYIAVNKFFKKKAPKSCGRKDFSEIELDKILKKMKNLSSPDILATLSEITILPIINKIKNRKIRLLIVSGGGAYNHYLLKRLEKSLRGIKVLTSEDIGWPVQAVEGGAFALLARYKVLGIKPDLSYMGVNKVLSPLGRMD